MIWLLVVLLQVSIVYNFWTLINIFVSPHKHSLLYFFVTLILNFILTLFLLLYVKFNLVKLADFDYFLLSIVLSGVIFGIILLYRVYFFAKFLKRTRNQKNFSKTNSGPKNYKNSVMTQNEVIQFFFTMPAFLMSGAYFIAALIKFLWKN